jgi:hypothetical protein
MALTVTCGVPGRQTRFSGAPAHAERGGIRDRPIRRVVGADERRGRCWRRYSPRRTSSRAGAVGVGRRRDRCQHRDLCRRRPDHRARGTCRNADFVLLLCRSCSTCPEKALSHSTPSTVSFMGKSCRSKARRNYPEPVLLDTLTNGVAIPIDPDSRGLTDPSCSSVAPRRHEARPTGTAT